MDTVFLRGKDNLFLSVVAFNTENPKGVVQIIHGVAEHKERYFDFCRFLAANGYAVIISDVRGHGKSINRNNPIGYISSLDDVISDQTIITEYIKHKYPDKPLYLLGHSLGAIFARIYLMKNDDKIDKLVLSGAPNYITGVGIVNPLTKFFLKFGDGRGFFPLFKMVPGAGGGDIAWVCSNPKVLEEYKADPYCGGYRLKNRGLSTMFDGVHKLHKRKKYQLKKPTLPIFSISGEQDPCTGGKRGLKDTIKTLRKIGYFDIKVKVYPNMKHEVLNEIGKDEVYQDVLNFFNE
ncbi:MAG: alpha/beta hydrolase [Lachnospiraceae bacterium]|nr:alpha/beta hydrolase [Lachnospiraceae bacterium]